ncbi:MAG: helix-turn-helix transcriptional regulator [Coriobacteriales bacterium]|jgi:MerR family transcriptional regulator/heat shock protein HspR|nr:helix-turn-helix transcriptional regulator [Coriobacteriales bacterium]
MNDKKRPLYMISVAAELVGMHPQTLRVYDSRGLVSPKRSGGNTRLYSQADLEQLELIGQLTDEGINLAGVTRILDLEARLAVTEDHLEQQQRRVRRLQERLHELGRHQQVTALVRLKPREISPWAANRLQDKSRVRSNNETR